ncbi:substrate-binding domain-containing protein [Vallitalea pronyensis]|uniref:Substrate-binding domain-containing protein n=1 Tax=Vallitalea pronyensis TaxID=1348613 RepID=A0A8J8SFU9_9FIRM|nr:substrate-binding domain-containing protein [Vallitalea pronyensis]QUI22075.1 substrate-binding domain-containing protein [Vallitalea pronyensis]
MGKVTMQHIADALGISRVSVWKVFNKQSGISEKLKNDVLAKAEELGYFRNMVLKETAPQRNKTIAVIVARPESATFWTNIIFQISSELSRHNINLMYATIPSEFSSSFSLPNMLTDRTISGVIVLNIYDTRILSEINRLSLPKVFLDITPDFPIRELSGDLILLEGYETIRKITSSVISKGCSKIGFIGDTRYAKTNQDRYKGFVRTLKENNIEFKKEYCLIDHIDIYSYYVQMTKFFDSFNDLPEAFICANDHIASFLYQYFSEHPERLTHDIMVTGYDGSSEYLNVSGLLTTAFVNTEDLGRRLAYQIRFREENPAAQYELTYIYPEIIYRDYNLSP